ncbi:hypothetical protein DJICPGNB_26040 [Escherichia coli]|nr:hypothetical protein DJICPGNB_26040 [Escherichia coli]
MNNLQLEHFTNVWRQERFAASSLSEKGCAEMRPSQIIIDKDI